MGEAGGAGAGARVGAGAGAGIVGVTKGAGGELEELEEGMHKEGLHHGGKERRVRRALGGLKCWRGTEEVWNS